MSKKVLRYFFGFLGSQEKWLNYMAEQGYRLVSVGQLVYQFESCQSKQYQYCVDFVAEKSDAQLKQYQTFLQDMGYRVFSKNLNLSWSFGKVRFRPYSGKAMLATSPGTLGKELLIVEKPNDGKPFILHTTAEDKIHYYKIQQSSCWMLAIFGGLMGILALYQERTLTAPFILSMMLCIVSASVGFAWQKKLWCIKKDSSINQ